MADDRATRRKQFREKLAELRHAAFVELESRGYEVRGKTAIQIRQMLKLRPSKQKSTTNQNTTGFVVRATPTVPHTE